MRRPCHTHGHELELELIQSHMDRSQCCGVKCTHTHGHTEIVGYRKFPPLCTRICPYPFFEATPQPRAPPPNPLLKPGAPVRRFRGCNKRTRSKRHDRNLTGRHIDRNRDGARDRSLFPTRHTTVYRAPPQIDIYITLTCHLAAFVVKGSTRMNSTKSDCRSFAC